MTSGAKPRPRTRIQARNLETILEAALEVFSTYGFRGATLDQIPTSPDADGEPRGVSLSFRVILSTDDIPLQR